MTKGHKEKFVGIICLLFFIMVMVLQEYSYVQTSQVVYFKHLQLIVCHYYYFINYTIIINHNKTF